MSNQPSVPKSLNASQDAVREQLSCILASEDFQASKRNRRFLEFVVDYTLNGQADRIKAYTIATDVFGRGTDFDPQRDAIVRIEAGRLRRSLEHYYLKAGAGDPVRITLPKGHYAPAFQSVAVLADRTLTATKSNKQLPVILVQQFKIEDSASSDLAFSLRLADHLTVGLKLFSDLFVCDGAHQYAHPAAHRRSDVSADFVLGGAIAVCYQNLYIDALLWSSATGQYIWAENYHVPYKRRQLISVGDEISDKIAKAITKPDGAVYRYFWAT